MVKGKRELSLEFINVIIFAPTTLSVNTYALGCVIYETSIQEYRDDIMILWYTTGLFT